MVDENTRRTIPGLDLVCGTNVVVVSPAVFAENVSIHTDRPQIVFTSSVPTLRAGTLMHTFTWDTSFDAYLYLGGVSATDSSV